MVLGVAVSGPYKLETRVALAPGEQAELNGYTFTLREISHAFDPAEHRNTETALLDISAPNRQPLGTLAPAQNLYYKTGLITREAAVRSSLGRDIYAAPLGRAGNKALLLLSIHPLINWLWLGAALICTAAAFRLAKHRAYRHGRP